MKRLSWLLLLPVMLLGLLWHPSLAQAAFNPSDLIDDSVLNNTGSMSIAQINAFLNTFPSSCISTNNGFSAPDPTGYTPSGGNTYGANVSAGQVIYDSALAYGLNPQVLLVTLQKEESLVSGGAGCSTIQYSAAVGFACPDSGGSYSYGGIILYAINGVNVTAVNNTCVNSAYYVGFSEQLINAAWLFRFGEQRSEGNVNWDAASTNYPQQGDVWDNSDDPPKCYSGPMTQGTFSRGPCQPTAVYYDGYDTIDGSSTYLDNGATAALYWYTPHFSGNENFDTLFNDWFGSPTSICSETGNVSGATSGGNITTYQYSASQPTNLAYTQMNNTGSGCVELHVENPGFQSWFTHIPTAMKAANPTQGMLVAGSSPVDHAYSLNYITYADGNGLAEVHRFSPDLKIFPGYYDQVTNLSGVSPSTGTFVDGDFMGWGTDQLVYILYSGNGGNMEVHMFNPAMNSAIGYYDLVSNIGGVSATSGVWLAGDFLGRGYDQLAYVTYGNTTVHVLDIRTGKVIRLYEQNTNLTNTSAATGTFVSGDFLGRGYDQLAYVLYDGASGNVETHMFNPQLNNAIGYQDLITNISAFNPSN